MKAGGGACCELLMQTRTHTMKPTLLALAITATAWFVPHLGALKAQTQTAAVAPAAAMRYRVIDMNKIPLLNAKTPAESLEAMLNDLSAQGWSFVTISGTLIVLANG